MTTWEVAQAFAALCAEGKHEEAGDRFWAPDVVSLEAAQGDGFGRAEGAAAVRAKGEWWAENHEVHGTRVDGPWPHGDQFALRFWMDVTPKGGARMQMDEIGLYTVRDGKIVEERFFYSTA
ncbi:SnoaL-like domain-containing protein [Rubrimonas sp.]|uniref:SnoaL-like domain-containing protein n=1 Tax=Rubrimonas sp. TaxID=2036015 RepID=UPI002FDE3330